MNGPIAQDALLSFARPSRSALRPSTSRRLTSLPRVTPTIVPALLITRTSSGSGLFQTDFGWIPTRAPSPTAAIGGHFVNSSASGPMPTSRYCDHMPLVMSTSLTRAASGEPGRMPRRSGPMIAWISRRAPARALLDDPLEQARDERDAARLHSLEIARREEPRLRAVARTLDAVGNQRVETTQRGRLTDRGADLLGLGHVQQMAGGRIRARQIHGLGTAHADDGRAVVGRQPGASDQQGVAVPRHRLLDRKRQLGHQSVSSTRA